MAGLRVVNLEGHVTVADAATTADTLREAIQQAERVVLHIGRLESLHLAAIQLLVAALVEANALGKSLHLAGPLSDGVASAAVASGICESSPQDGRMLEVALRERVGLPLHDGGAEDE